MKFMRMKYNRKKFIQKKYNKSLIYFRKVMKRKKINIFNWTTKLNK